jgi:ribosomal-protein-alanine N-acetyltransferase
MRWCGMIDTRRMTIADLPRIAEIQAHSPEAAHWKPEDYLHYQSWVAESGPALAGFLVLRETAPGEAEILNIAVDPACRRQGVAAALLRGASLHRFEQVYLEVRESNAAARALYTAFGFIGSGIRPNYYDCPREAGIVMKLQKWYGLGDEGPTGPLNV